MPLCCRRSATAGTIRGSDGRCLVCLLGSFNRSHEGPLGWLIDCVAGCDRSFGRLRSAALSVDQSFVPASLPAFSVVFPELQAVVRPAVQGGASLLSIAVILGFARGLSVQLPFLQESTQPQWGPSMIDCRFQQTSAARSLRSANSRGTILRKHRSSVT